MNFTWLVAVPVATDLSKLVISMSLYRFFVPDLNNTGDLVMFRFTEPLTGICRFKLFLNWNFDSSTEFLVPNLDFIPRLYST
jgi:hypothetical protein